MRPPRPARPPEGFPVQSAGVLGLPANGSCHDLAGRADPAKVTYPGVATVYKAGVGDGACSYGPSGDMMIAAMNTTDYEASRACGAYVRVHAAPPSRSRSPMSAPCPVHPANSTSTNRPSPNWPPVSTGRLAITWSLLSPDTAGTISIRYKNGSSPYWCGIQAVGHRNPLARLEVRSGSGWHQLTRTDYNYFLAPDGRGWGGAIRLTDICGQQLTTNQIALRPDVIRPTRVQFARH
ncbi:expansin EXLX1 family cellulose-binding protein [Streptomyces sp. NPDC001714]|uniref:expansin EXLX1 family cellulose-binding protein n=1 Tax=Streptomyces sp. NPDC001714 TaxID=3364603 RepID=UPI003674F2CA